MSRLPYGYIGAKPAAPGLPVKTPRAAAHVAVHAPKAVKIPAFKAAIKPAAVKANPIPDSLATILGRLAATTRQPSQLARAAAPRVNAQRVKP